MDGAVRQFELYKKKHGHCNVPQNEGSLRNWANNQHHLHKHNRVQKDRKDMLEEIGFVWEPHDDNWQNKYKKLKELRETYGHASLPDGEYPLRAWISAHRLDYAAGQLDPERWMRLDELGLVWVDPDFERHERQWNEKFRELEDFNRRRGHVRVPVKTSALGEWVKWPRALYIIKPGCWNTEN
jgi:hypothetical protein